MRMSTLSRILLIFTFCFQLNAGDTIALYRYSFDVAKGEPILPQSLTLQPEQISRYNHYLIHLRQPMDAPIRQHLTELGLHVLSYIPNNAFIVRTSNLALLDTVPFIDWFGPWQPAYKLHPALDSINASAELNEGLLLELTLHPGADMGRTQEQVTLLGGEVLDLLNAYPVQRLTLRLDFARLTELAFIDDVLWISERGQRQLRNDDARWLIQSYQAPSPASRVTPLYDYGLHGESEILGLIDSTPDLSHCSLLDAEGDNPGPNHRKMVSFQSTQAPHFHGTHVANTLAGRAESTLSGAGIAYEARIAYTTLPGNQSGNLFDLFFDHATQGVAVHSNSWGESQGSSVAQDYTSDCVDIDNYSWQDEGALVVFACNNSGWPLTPILSPENALNVLAVGATEHGAGMFPELLAERHGSCSTGPVPLDLRRKPELFAPGCALLSADVDSACALRTRCGTSMAAPVVAASAGLIRQYFREGMYPFGRRVSGFEMLPSGALMKCLLLLGSEDMLEETETVPDVFINEPIPNAVEGWGRLQLDNSLYFEGDRKRLLVWDVRNLNGLQTGERNIQAVRVLSPDEPLHFGLVFTQPPGTQGTLSPVTNDLDLVVTSPSGIRYLGNFFGGGMSMPDGFTDEINNVEMVRLLKPEVGLYQVEVVATAVNMGPQGFALSSSGEVVEGDCDLIQLNAGADSELTCWGEWRRLGEGLPHGALEFTWSPVAGLSDPAARNPLATPTQTTTYEVSVTLASGCVRSAQVTLRVPAMDVNQNEQLDPDDLTAYLGLGYWDQGIFGDPNPMADWNDDEVINVNDLILLINCIGGTP